MKRTIAILLAVIFVLSGCALNTSSPDDDLYLEYFKYDKSSEFNTMVLLDAIKDLTDEQYLVADQSVETDEVIINFVAKGVFGGHIFTKFEFEFKNLTAEPPKISTSLCLKEDEPLPIFSNSSISQYNDIKNKVSTSSYYITFESRVLDLAQPYLIKVSVGENEYYFNAVPPFNELKVKKPILKDRSSNVN